MRNGNEEMRLSTGKLVHASQKLAHCINFLLQEIMAELIHCKSYCPYRLWAVWQIRDWSGLTWVVKTEPSDHLDGDRNSDGSSDNSGQLKNTIRADIRVR